jgi:JmjC domain
VEVLSVFSFFVIDVQTVDVRKYQTQMTAVQPSTAAACSLASLLAPVSLKQFADVFWGREPLHIARESSGFYDGLISLAEVERYFSLGELFNRHSVQTVSGRWGGGNGPPQTLGDVNDRLLHGDSLRLRRMECFLDPSAPIVALARQMESTLQHPLNSLSCYITPVGAVGLGPHHDETEIFTLQIEGTKRWQLFQRVASTEPAMYERTALGAPSVELTLAAGDMLYVPNGWVHDVVNDDASFSITMVFDPFRWSTLLDVLRDRLTGSAPWIETLPIGVALGGGEAGFRQQIARCIDALRDELDAFEDTMLVDALASRFLTRMTLPPGHAVRDTLRPARLTPATLVRRRPGVAYHLARHDDVVALMVPGGQVIRAPRQAEPALRDMLAREQPFRAADAESTLDTVTTMWLVRLMIGAGLLELANHDGR